MTNKLSYCALKKLRKETKPHKISDLSLDVRWQLASHCCGAYHRLFDWMSIRSKRFPYWLFPFRFWRAQEQILDESGFWLVELDRAGNDVLGYSVLDILGDSRAYIGRHYSLS